MGTQRCIPLGAMMRVFNERERDFIEFLGRQLFAEIRATD